MMARYFLIFVFVLMSSGCDRTALHFKNIDITGNTNFAGDFSLLDSQGQTKHLTDFRGKVVLLFLAIPSVPMFVLLLWPKCVTLLVCWVKMLTNYKWSSSPWTQNAIQQICLLSMYRVSIRVLLVCVLLIWRH